ncbi:DUF871 domain-containing protein [Mesoplasma seiffertii]|uniref:DUF871 domain-containing protein n=1 Tax=Mesoplasma seiffertii TaxID=28224 RepID=UPI000478EC3A|nr:MupG family TIM beta-alpha barrel fold protein [Mesoplasma seiffertii]
MQRKRIGISIYPEKAPLEETLKYLKTARDLGYEMVFVSFIHLQKHQQAEIAVVKQAIKYANELNFYIIADFHYPSLEMLEIPIDDFKLIYEMGISCVRFDSPALPKELADLTHNEYGIDIQLNMSNNDHLITNVLDYQPVLTRLNGCHNFYPQKHTGLPFDFFREANKKYVTKNLETSAFIGSHFGNQGPAGVNHELVTIEALRYLPCSTQAKYLFYTNEINNVLFGNAFATQTELEELVKVNRDEITLKIQLQPDITDEEMTILKWKKHFRRGDITEAFIRSTMTRVIYKDLEILSKKGPETFNRGDVIVVNKNGNSYKGELHIILIDNFKVDNNEYNLVGKIDQSELMLLDYVKPWAHFRFE